MLPESQWLTDPLQRPDEAVLTDVSDRLWQDPTTRAHERSALAVEVRAGQVLLAGHVTTQRYRQHVVDLVRGVRGVRAIHNALVADPDLVIEVAQALAADALTRAAVIRVGASHGWILLAGEVPDEPTRLAAEQAAARVAGVRGVLGLPHLPAGHGASADFRRPLQPRGGQAVHAADGRAGLVEHVVISPHSRLVSHIVVTGTPEVNWVPVRGGWVVPITAVAQASAGGVFLSEKLSALVAHKAYRAADFRSPPAEWRLPFPYTAAEVLWLAEPEAVPLIVPVAAFMAASRPPALSAVR